MYNSSIDTDRPYRPFKDFFFLIATPAFRKQRHGDSGNSMH